MENNYLRAIALRYSCSQNQKSIKSYYFYVNSKRSLSIKIVSIEIVKLLYREQIFKEIIMAIGKVVDHETITSDSEFNIINYGFNLNKQLNYISDKIKAAEIKITSLKTKEKIIDDMIVRSNESVEHYTTEKNFKLAGIHSSYILTQFETLAQVQEMLIKYEDMIQKYIKMTIDIENHKINAHVKLTNAKKEDNKNEDSYEKLMGQMHELINTQTQSPGSSPVLLDSVKEQLKLEGY